MMSKESKILLFVLTLTQICDVSVAQGTSRSRLVTSSEATENGGALDVHVADDGVGDTVGKWLKDRNIEAVKIFRDAADAEWRFYTNMTENNRNTLVNMRFKKAAFERESARKALTWNWESLSEADRRQLEKMVDIGIAATDKRTKFERAEWLETEEEKVYSNSKVMIDGLWSNMIPDAYDKFATTKGIDVKADIWRHVHVSLNGIKDLFMERVELMNEAYQLLGYQDASDYWTTVYQIRNFQSAVDALWKEVEPLYQLLHIYVRHKLKLNYNNDDLFPSSGHVPEHLISSLGSSDWIGIYNDVKPFLDITKYNITKGLFRKVNEVKEVAEQVNSFFESVDLNISSTLFWKDSLFARPKDINVSCVPGVLNTYNGYARLQICGGINQRSFLSFFGLLGEAAYMSSYSDQPVPFQSQALPGLGSAIGESIALSALTPANLKRFNITDAVSEGYKNDVNFLLWMALRILPRLAHDYALGLWKSDVYSRYVNTTGYNSHWWNLRCKYEGVTAADTRSEYDFDAGSDVEAWKFVPYYRSFISTVLQFQLHDALCYQIGHTGALHRCSILDHKNIGQKLRGMMSLGSSLPWHGQVKAITGDNGLRVQSLLSYFSPLKIWLQGEVSRIDDRTELGKTCDWVVSAATLSAKTFLSDNILHRLLLLVYCVFLLTVS